MADRVAVIGLGGMGVRHAAALKNIGAQLVAVCDMRKDVLEKFQKENPSTQVFTDYRSLLEAHAQSLDLLSVVTNTPSRPEVCKYAMTCGVKRILTEKPFTTSLAEAYDLSKRAEKLQVRLGVNTYRYVSENHLRLRDLLRSGSLGKLRHISIHSASAGLGNMGSVFFAIMNFFAESPVDTVTGYIDSTGTPSARGAQFQDPGGFGMVTFKNGIRGFIDTSEDTGVPYTFHLVTSHARIFIDEQFDKWEITARSEADQKSPLTHYFKPLLPVPFELNHKWDVVRLTEKACQAMLAKAPIEFDEKQATAVMEMIVAMHVSHKQGHIPVRIPLESSYHSFSIPFA